MQAPIGFFDEYEYRSDCCNSQRAVICFVHAGLPELIAMRTLVDLIVTVAVLAIYVFSYLYAKSLLQQASSRYGQPHYAKTAISFRTILKYENVRTAKLTMISEKHVFYAG